MNAFIKKFAFTSLLCLALPAQAQVLDTTLLIDQLAASNQGPMVTALQAQNALTLPKHQQIPASFDFAAQNVYVEFNGNGVLLTSNGMVALRSVAAALMDPRLSDQTFQVAAHLWFAEDAGTIMQVSQMRAQSVVDHLHAYYDIPADRLVPVGYGANKPVNMAVPASPENTRIELINVTGL